MTELKTEAERWDVYTAEARVQRALSPEEAMQRRAEFARRACWHQEMGACWYALAATFRERYSDTSFGEGDAKFFADASEAHYRTARHFLWATLVK